MIDRRWFVTPDLLQWKQKLAWIELLPKVERLEIQIGEGQITHLPPHFLGLQHLPG
jgi:hypothetical protein